MKKLILKHQIALAERAGLGPEHASEFEVIVPYDPKIIAQEALKRMDRLRGIDPEQLRDRPDVAGVLIYAATFLDGRAGYEKTARDIATFLKDRNLMEDYAEPSRDERQSPFSAKRGQNKGLYNVRAPWFLRYEKD